MDNKIFTYFQAFLVALFWGISFLAIDKVLDVLRPMEQLATRWTIASLTILFLMVLGIIKVNYKGKPIKYILFLSLIEPCFYSIFETYGVKYTTVSESSIIIALIPIFVAILSAVFLKQKLQGATIVSIVICFIGLLFTVVFEPDFSFGTISIGYLFLFLAVLLGASYSIVASAIANKFTPLEITVIMTFSGGIFFNIIAFATGSNLGMYISLANNPIALVSSLFLGIICSVVTFFLFNTVLGKISPALASVFIINLITVIGVMAGVLVNNDSLSVYKVMGVIMIVSGIAVSSLRRRKPSL